MPPINFPLRWESTGDQWWYASPIDFAAANGHYDLVRELIRIDNNHLFTLTSLRRIRRLETVWDDEEQFHDVAKCRSAVARKLFLECESKKGKNSLIKASYGGWLMYTAASAGDIGFVQELLQRDPLIVFGEGEYGVTDILFAAARSKNSAVFRLVFDYAVSPRFVNMQGQDVEAHIGEIPSIYKTEMFKRAAHAAARGGNLEILKEILGDCDDILGYRDVQGSTILHAAAGRGQVEVVKDLIASYDIINAIDNQGNTALHIAAYRGHLAVVETLILAAPSSISVRNNAGDTFLHMAFSGFQTPTFRRLDRQVALMKQLICGKIFNIEEVINVKNNDGRTALHMAIVKNIHSDLIQLLMTVPSIEVNIRDVDGMTPLDILRQRPCSPSSDILARQLISAGGIFGYQDNAARRVIASCLRNQGSGHSPGTSFRVSDTDIFSYTGNDNASISCGDQGSNNLSSSSGECGQVGSTEVNNSSPVTYKKLGYVNYAAHRLKNMFHWPLEREKQVDKSKKLVDEETSVKSYKRGCRSQEIPVPLRQRFSKPSSLPNNKRTLSVRSNIPSPSNRKKLASGVMHGVMQDMPHLVVPAQSPPSSTSKVSFSSSNAVDKQKGIYIDNDDIGPSSSCSNQVADDIGPSNSCSNQVSDDETPRVIGREHSVNKRFKFCFGAPGVASRRSISRQRDKQNPNVSVASRA